MSAFTKTSGCSLRATIMALLLAALACGNEPKLVPTPNGCTDCDAGNLDAGWSDSGVLPDAGEDDGGGLDPETDGGSGTDGGEEDAGSCEPSTPCEKQLGVCADSMRACVDGVRESVCTSLSYGSRYAEADLLCDGLDNDCDGLVDVSETLYLGAEGDEFWSHSWARSRDGFWISVVRDGGTAIQQFSLNGAALGTGIWLDRSAHPTQTSPLLEAFGDSVVAMWRQTDLDAGIDTLSVARIFSDGGSAFGPASTEGVPASWQTTRPANGARYQIVPSNSGSCVYVLWNDSCSGWLRRAVSLSPNGMPRSAVIDFIPIGSYCGLESPTFVAAVENDSLWAADTYERFDGGFDVNFDTYDCSFDAGIPQRKTFVGTQPSYLAMFENLRAPFSSAADDLFLVQLGYPNGWKGSSLIDGTELSLWEPGRDYRTTFDGTIHRDDAGVFSTYWTYEYDGGRPNLQRGFAYRPSSGELVDFTPPAEVVGTSWPDSLDLGDGRYLAGFVVDAGTHLEIGIRYFCPP